MSWSAIGPSLTNTHFTPSFNLSDKNHRGEPRFGLVGLSGKQPLSLQFGSSTGTRKMGKNSCSRITMRDRSKNRKPLQRGRNLSIEAIQIIQALKRAAARDHQQSLEQVFAYKFKRLLKLDMMAVLRELLRQNECLLALKVFEDIQKEYWYKPEVSLYGEILRVLGSNGLYEKADLLFTELKTELKTETGLEPDTEGFNVLVENLMSFDMMGLAIECFYLMKSLGCDPGKSFFRILISGLEVKGEVGLSAIVRQEAEKYYGKHLEFLEEQAQLVRS